MTGISAITAIGAPAMDARAGIERVANALPQRGAAPVDFSTLLSQGLATMDSKVARADDMVTRFALDDSVPVHQVTIALEEARLSVEFAMQVRQRFVEGYKELMNMQL